MDAVSLAVPVTNLPKTAVGGSDNAALTEDSDRQPVDFATLLAAAGIGLHEQSLEPALQSSEAPQEQKAAAEAPVDPTTLAAPLDPATAGGPALQTAVPVVERPATAQGKIDAADDTHQPISATMAARKPEGMPVAGEAARIAASATDDTKAIEAPPLQAEDDPTRELQALADTSDAQRIDATEAATQAYNTQPIEQRPTIEQPVAVREVGAPVGSVGFADELSRQVVWMVDKDAQIAELRINPPDLGPVEVRLSVSGDQASAHFVSTHAEVREALETSIARLRESFAQAGIQLGQASVSAESFREQTSGQSDARSNRSAYHESPVATGASITATMASKVHRGLVDTFA